MGPGDGPHEFSGTGRRIAPLDGSHGGAAASGGEPIGQTSSALTTSVHTAIQRTKRELAETSAAAYENASGQWEMVWAPTPQ
jgi:hypothetical protein